MGFDPISFGLDQCHIIKYPYQLLRFFFGNDGGRVSLGLFRATKNTKKKLRRLLTFGK